MKTLNLLPAARARGTRPSAPRCRNGVSSVLRLSQPAAGRLPAPQFLSDWAGRAGSLLGGPELVLGPVR